MATPLDSQVTVVVAEEQERVRLHQLVPVENRHSVAVEAAGVVTEALFSNRQLVAGTETDRVEPLELQVQPQRLVLRDHI